MQSGFGQINEGEAIEMDPPSLPDSEIQEEEEEELPELALHHIVLGRYGGTRSKPLHGKTKPLSEPIRVYKEYRETIERSKLYTDEDVEKFRWDITKFIRQELEMPDLPLVQFVVDHKKFEALKAEGKLPEAVMNITPRKVQHKRSGVIFVKDETAYFFKQELKENNRNRGIHAPQKPKAKQPPPTMFSDNNNPSVATVTPTAVDANEGSVAADLGAASGHELSMTDNELMDLIEDLSNHPGGIAPTMDQKSLADEAPGFVFQQGSGTTLEQQVDEFCADWIRSSYESGNLKELIRKPNMVMSFQAYFQFYQKLLLRNNPFANSTVPGLRDLPQLMLVACVTNMLQHMKESYDKHPMSCLEDEADPWSGNTHTCCAASTPHLQNGFPTQERSLNTSTAKKRKTSSSPVISFKTPQDDIEEGIHRHYSDPYIPCLQDNQVPETMRSCPDFGSAPEVCASHHPPLAASRHVPDIESPAVLTTTARDDEEQDSVSINNNDEDLDDIMKVIAARSRAAAAEPTVPDLQRLSTSSLPRVVSVTSDIENQESVGSMITHPIGDARSSATVKEDSLRSGLQQILLSSQESARSVVMLSQRSLMAPDPPTRHNSDPPRLSNVVASPVAEDSESADNTSIANAIFEREMNWIKRCQYRSERLMHHMDHFTCNGQLYRTMQSLRDNFTWALGMPIGYAVYFVFVEIPVFLFYLVFCGVVGATCCVLFLVSFWEANFWDPSTSAPLSCEDWAWKVPMFVVGSFGYLLATPLVLFSLMTGWAAEYIQHPRSSGAG